MRKVCSERTIDRNQTNRQARNSIYSALIASQNLGVCVCTNDLAHVCVCAHGSCGVAVFILVKALQ